MKQFTALFNLPLLITPAVLLFTTLSCGRPVTDDCQSKDLNILCHTLYNEETKYIPAPPVNNTDLQLEAKVLANNSRIEAILLRLDLVEAGLPLISVNLAEIIAELVNLSNRIDALDSDHSSFLLQFTELNTQLVNLSGVVNTLSQGNIVDLIDLCDNHKEILIKLGDGSLIALYGGNKAKEHRLQVLTPGNYKSTDGEHCHFTVNSDLSVSW